MDEVEIEVVNAPLLERELAGRLDVLVGVVRVLRRRRCKFSDGALKMAGEGNPRPAQA